MAGRAVPTWLAPSEQVREWFSNASLSMATGNRQLTVGRGGMVQSGKYQWVKAPELLVTNFRMVLLDPGAGAKVQILFSLPFLRFYLPRTRVQNSPDLMDRDPLGRLQKLFLPPGTADEWSSTMGGSNFFQVATGAEQSKGLFGPKEEIEMPLSIFRPPEAIERMRGRGHLFDNFTGRHLAKVSGFYSPINQFLKAKEAGRLLDLATFLNASAAGVTDYISDDDDVSADYYGPPVDSLEALSVLHPPSQASASPEPGGPPASLGAPAAPAVGGAYRPPQSSRPQGIPPSKLMELRRRVVMARADTSGSGDADRQRLWQELDDLAATASPDDEPTLRELQSLLSG